ncbi:hypothetical protein [Halorientalis marina]|jgi:hypothetical protein|uniref:hypothetical protein n=1 Tax=Halorientalis marina TaxID=2931976 RepID=UPI001FF2F54A|nr:hypothetical protein [Halorientalis marina]
MLSRIVAHAAGGPSTIHTLLDVGLGVGAGGLLVGLFYLWLRRVGGSDRRRTGLE